MFLKKSLVLVGTKNEEEKAVLTLEKKDDFFDGRIRFYNFSNEPNGILSIGFYDGEKVVKCGLSRVSSMLYNFKTDADELPEKFSCAVVNFSKGEMDSLLYGNTDGYSNKTSQLGKIMTSAFNEKIGVEEVTRVLDENGVDYDDELKNEIEEEIEKNFCGNCSTCKYKNAFFENNNFKVISNFEEEKQKPSFFSEIKGKIESLFAKSEKEEFLEEIIPNSKWVKVEYEDDGDYYILGLIYEQNELKYIVYGVPGVYQKLPPKEIAGYPVWFPLDKEKRESFGYWLSYQDANTGESIRAIVE